MNAVIVGHGPSILAAEVGEWIDEHDRVIRLKRCQDTLKYPEYYGKGTDILGGSWTIAKMLPDLDQEETWIFTDSRHEGVTPEQIAEMDAYFNGTAVIDKPLCDRWDAVYRKVANGEGHKHTSQGMKAIIYACAFLEIDKLDLVGFDNIATGEFTWSVTRGPNYEQYPDHNWSAESDLVDMVAKYYEVDIESFMPADFNTTSQ